MKIFSWLTIGGFVLYSLSWPMGIASARNDDGTNIHIDQSRQFPETRWANADHFIRIHVPSNSKALRTIRLQVPENFKFNTKQVAILETTGRQTVAKIFDKNLQPQRNILIEFAVPIPKDTQFDIRIHNVNRTTVSRSASYLVFANTIDTDQDQFVGEAYFRSY
jgi:Protein of unknown function (DUF2808)